MARPLALAAAMAASLLVLAGAGGAATQQSPKRGGTVVVGWPGFDPACLNVLLSRCVVGDTPGTIVAGVLGTMYAYGPDLSPVPRLVSSVRYTTRRPFTLVIRIRPEARWSDGVPVTAGDFIFTLKAIRKYVQDDALHSAVRSANPIDGKTLRVVLRPKTAGWRKLFYFVLPAHALRDTDLTKVWLDAIDDPRTGDPIGSGPFLVVDWERGKQIVLERNPEYWGKRVSLDRVVLRFGMTPRERALALRAGELDIAPVDEEDALALRRDGFPVAAGGAFGLEHLELRQGAGGPRALRNKLVRRALAFGIDRIALVRGVWGELLPKHPWADSAVFLSQSRLHQPNWEPYRHDLARARRLLEQAGCRRGADRIYACGEERLSLRLMTTANVPSRRRAIEILARQLQTMGIDARPEVLPASVFFRLLARGDFDAALFSWILSPDDTSQLKNAYGCQGSTNFSGYCQRLSTRDLDQADRILDHDQRARVLSRVDRQLARDVAMIPLYQFVFSLARSSSLRGFELNPAGSLPLNAEDWWLDD